MSATVPTGLDPEALEFTLGSIEDAADLVREFFQRGRTLMGGREGGLAPSAEPVVMIGAALGLPGGGGADTFAPIRAAMVG